VASAQHGEEEGKVRETSCFAPKCGAEPLGSVFASCPKPVEDAQELQRARTRCHTRVGESSSMRSVLKLEKRHLKSSFADREMQDAVTWGDVMCYAIK